MSGRMENYKGAIIDFAVTIEALKKDMEFLNRNKKGKIISVISRIEGASDSEYKMFSNIASKYSDYTIITTDRNKTNVSHAVNILKENMNNTYEVILNRESAIKKALKIKDKNDIVYIVGVESFYKNINEKYVNPYRVIDESL